MNENQRLQKNSLPVMTINYEKSTVQKSVPMCHELFLKKFCPTWAEFSKPHFCPGWTEVEKLTSTQVVSKSKITSTQLAEK